MLCFLRAGGALSKPHKPHYGKPFQVFMKSSNRIFGNSTPDPIKMPVKPKPCSSRLLGRPGWCVGAPETRCRRPGEMPLHHVRLVPGRPTGRTTGASALPSAISRLTWRGSPARTAPPSCAARIAITISWQSRNRAATSTRNSWRASPHHHRDNTGSSIEVPTSPVTTSPRHLAQHA
jgi:PAB1-binding protein PBP1